MGIIFYHGVEYLVECDSEQTADRLKEMIDHEFHSWYRRSRPQVFRYHETCFVRLVHQHMTDDRLIESDLFWTNRKEWLANTDYFVKKLDEDPFEATPDEMKKLDYVKKLAEQDEGIRGGAWYEVNDIISMEELVMNLAPEDAPFTSSGGCCCR